ncbi:MAG: Eco57I restriction-modification methylase domain-containing protein [Planctomycetaceae bacterium]
MTGIEEREIARLELQSKLDGAKSQSERNRLGQFATPPKFAAEIVKAAAAHLPPDAPIRFLDPGFGTGSFFSALLNSIRTSRIDAAEGFEIDPHYGEDARKLWSGTGLRLHLADFTAATPPAEADRFNLVVCNPPYVRHHHLRRSQKRDLQSAARDAGSEMNGLSGLYCYFMVLSQAWMANEGVAAWLVPSEFMDVNYGVHVKRFLLEKVKLLRIHRFAPKDVQFDDAFVSSAVVFFQNTPAPDFHEVEFTFGGTLATPEMGATVLTERLRLISKWTSLPQRESHVVEPNGRGTLADLFQIKRGVATGCNEFFVLSPERIAEHGIPQAFLKPILPSPRNLEVTEIPADRLGNPKIRHQRFLLDCDLPENELRETHPAVWNYLIDGVKAGVDQRYLCRHREPWYSQERRPPAPFLCTYMGRPTRKSDVPFRFILNHSKATAANVYLLLYPKPTLAAVLEGAPELGKAVWNALSSITAEMLIGEGRVYGGGLHKLEPKELANVAADMILDALPKECGHIRQKELFV